MSSTQPEILHAAPAHASFLQFSLVDSAQLRSVLGELNQLFDSQDTLIGFGAALLQQLEAEIPGAKGAESIRGSHRVSPVNQDELWLRVSGEDPGVVMHRVAQFRQVLEPCFSLNDITEGFKHREGRDLSGYVDGTENPESNAEQVVAMAGKPGIAGGSMLAVQKWHHQLSHLNSMPEKQQDDLIGRRKSDNVEFKGSPVSAHVKRTGQESFTPEAFMLRRSLPWAANGDCGLYFVCFAESLYPFEAQFKRMLGCEDGIEDGLFQFSRPLGTAYYWCPPVQDGKLNLQALGA